MTPDSRRAGAEDLRKEINGGGEYGHIDIKAGFELLREQMFSGGALPLSFSDLPGRARLGR